MPEKLTDRLEGPAPRTDIISAKKDERAVVCKSSFDRLRQTITPSLRGGMP